MRISTKRTLIVAAVFASLCLLMVVLSWLASFAADADLADCRRKCSEERRVGRIAAVEVKGTRKAGVYVTERKCICD